MHNDFIKITGSLSMMIGAPTITIVMMHLIHPNLNFNFNSLEPLNVYSWILFQAILFYFVPGKICQGSITPTGERLSYNINGIYIYPITFIIPWLIEIDIINNWGSMLMLAHLYGVISSVLAYIKGQKLSNGFNSFFHDFYAGLELNPRIYGFDLKLFTNSRIGMMSWSLVNNMYIAQYYRLNGTIPNSMILCNLLQSIYIVDFFVHEEWYLRTIDIAHDHFGFMLSWGSSVWVPFIYTIQIQYLYHHPVELSLIQYDLILILGLTGYLIFRVANDQKDYCRNNDIDRNSYIDAIYRTDDGFEHCTKLIYAGLWRYSRHCNYFGDLILSLAMCLTCGFDSIIPYFYFIYMTILLIHRSERDNHKCQQKYGKAWMTYTKLVPYKIIPYVY